MDYEIVVFFDYISEEILKCAFGGENVKITFDEKEFEGKHIASIHNHTKDMYTPPSQKNFGIFLREWEDYELIAGWNGLWILKGKYVDENLVNELRKESSKLFISSFNYYFKRSKSEEIAFNKCDELYGKRLLNYINNKNINDVQLIKRRYHYD